MKNKFKILVLIISTIFLTACVNKTNINEDEINLVEFDYKWKLESFLNKDLKNNKVYIKFQKERISGNLGCNAFFANYKIEKDNLNIGLIGSTMMFCDNLNLEKEVIAVLGKTKKYKILNKNLILLDNENNVLMIFK